jgi:hypothetical protein
MYEVTKKDVAYPKRLKAGAIAAPILLTAAPALITILLLLVAATGPPVAAVMLFGGIIATLIGLITGLSIAVVLTKKRSTWTKEMRERIAADGIKASELEWFRSELKTTEKRSLKAMENVDPMLADAYRETLASRLTATRIVKMSRRELQLAKQRQNSVKQLKSSRAEEFLEEISTDVQKINGIHDEAKVMLAEAESRLQMIEAAASRHGSLADSELALKRLSARASELPLALEAARMTDEIRLELEKEGIE